jgi:hypothetical protein
MRHLKLRFYPLIIGAIGVIAATGGYMTTR